MSSPRRRVQVSVTSVLNTLALSRDTASAWSGALRILSSVAAAMASASSQQQQQQRSQAEAETASHAKWVLPVALSLQCWTRSGRDATDFWDKIRDAIPSCKTTQCNSNDEDDASSVVATALEQWSEAGNHDAALLCVRPLMAASGAAPHNDADGEERVALDTIFGNSSSTSTTSAAATQRAYVALLSLAAKSACNVEHFCAFAAAALRLQPYLESTAQTHEDDVFPVLADTIASFANSLPVESDQPRSQASEAARLSHQRRKFDHPQQQQQQQQTQSSSENATDEPLRIIWQLTSTTLATTTTTDASLLISHARRIVDYCIASCSDPFTLATLIDKDLQQRQRPDVRAAIGNEALLIRVINRFHELSSSSSSSSSQQQPQSRNEQSVVTAQILRIADRLFPHVARSAAVYASVLRALRHQGAWQAAIEYSKAAPSFVRGDLDPALVRHLMMSSSASLASAAFQQQQQQQQNRTEHSNFNNNTLDEPVTAACSDIVDAYAASLQSESASSVHGSGTVATADSLAEVVRAALRAHRWDAALSVLQRVIVHQRMQLDPSIVASILAAPPSLEQQQAAMFGLATAAQRVPFFAGMARRAILMTRPRTGTGFSVQWITALAQMRSLAMIVPLSSSSSSSSSSTSSSDLLPYCNAVECALINVIDRGMLRLAHSLLQQVDFSANDVGIGRSLLLALQDQRKTLQAQLPEERWWGAAVDIILNAVSSSSGTAVKVQSSATPMLAHFLVLRWPADNEKQSFVPSRVVDALASNFGNSSGGWTVYSQQSRAVCAAARKRFTAARQQGGSCEQFVKQVLSDLTLSSRQDDATVAVLLGLLQATVVDVDATPEVELAVSIAQALTSIPRVIAELKNTDAFAALMTDKFLAAVAHHYEQGRISASESGGLERLMTAILPLVRADCVVAASLRLAATAAAAASNSNTSPVIDDTVRLGRRLSIEKNQVASRVFTIAVNAQLHQHQQSQQVQLSWENAAKLVAAQWECDAAPPQGNIALLLARYGAAVPRGAIAGWESRYRAMCPVASPSLLAAFVQARRRGGENQKVQETNKE